MKEHNTMNKIVDHYEWRIGQEIERLNAAILLNGFDDNTRTELRLFARSLQDYNSALHFDTVWGK
jgi:hypothetical protein